MVCVCTLSVCSRDCNAYADVDPRQMHGLAELAFREMATFQKNNVDLS